MESIGDLLLGLFWGPPISKLSIRFAYWLINPPNQRAQPGSLITEPKPIHDIWNRSMGTLRIFFLIDF